MPDGETASRASVAAPAAAWLEVSVRYPCSERAAVGPVSLDLKPGERLLLLGASGSGKSTLLGTLTGLIPRTIPAEVTGAVRVLGEPVEGRPPAGWAGTVAQFFQDAHQTLCGMRVFDEVAFALENRGLPEPEIRERVAAAMRQVGIPQSWGERRSMTLSGGEKQLVALAATLAQDVPILVADEPTAHLAPEAARRLHRILTEGGGRTVLLVDHRLDGLIAAVDQAAVLDPAGVIKAAGAPASLFRAHAGTLSASGIWVPVVARLDAALAARGLEAPVPPLALDDILGSKFDALKPDARAAAREVAVGFAAGELAPSAARGAVVAGLVGAHCAPYLGPTVLRDISLEIRAGEIVGVMGANGAGKSTLGLAIAGLLPLRGGRRFGPPGGVAFQNPENQFTTGSVREEVAAAIAAGAERAEAVLAEWSLTEFAGRHPFELSQGQKRRLALATLTASGRWPLIVLDEPTAGLDAAGAAAVEREVRRVAGQGHAVAVITHDMDLALRLCTRGIVLGAGKVVADGPVPELLGDTELLRLADLAPPAIAPLLRWLGAPC